MSSLNAIKSFATIDTASVRDAAEENLARGAVMEFRQAAPHIGKSHLYIKEVEVAVIQEDDVNFDKFMDEMADLMQTGESLEFGFGSFYFTNVDAESQEVLIRVYGDWYYFAL